jgi:ring-1,2-phenylacetyl-CoA epoxidase subunit PaaD
MAGQPGNLEASVWQALKGVTDPEIPVLNIVEMGLVRQVTVTPAGDQPGAGHSVSVVITPTFSGCPALHVIEENVARAVRTTGVSQVQVSTRLWPPWSTDEMTDGARAKLLRFGIAPPQPHGGLIQLALDAPVHCPRCGHPDTRLRNAFGSALCREIRTCQACHETFERFKPL